MFTFVKLTVNKNHKRAAVQLYGRNNVSLATMIKVKENITAYLDRISELYPGIPVRVEFSDEIFVTINV